MTGQGELLTDDLSLGEALRDLGMREATAAADPDEVVRVDRVIKAWADRHQPFSANDVRPELHGVRPMLVGARFRYAAKANVIRDTGEMVKSTLPSTRGHRIPVWIGAS